MGPLAKTCQFGNMAAGSSLERKFRIHSEEGTSATGMTIVSESALAGMSTVRGNAKFSRPASPQNGVGLDPPAVRVIAGGLTIVGLAEDCIAENDVDDDTAELLVLVINVVAGFVVID